MSDNDNAIVNKLENDGRIAWRKLLVPTVGSAAFFASMLVSIINTYANHGWPKNAFKTSGLFNVIVPMRSFFCNSIVSYFMISPLN